MIEGMISSLKNNKRNRETKFDKEITDTNDNYGKIEDYKKMSSEQFLDFKKKLKAQESLRQKRVSIVFASTMFLLIGLLIYFLFYH